MRNNKILLLILFTFTFTLASWAIPAKRGLWKTITLADGQQVKVELRGDEQIHWWQDSLGQRYFKNRNNGTEEWYRVTDNDWQESRGAGVASHAKKRMRRNRFHSAMSSDDKVKKAPLKGKHHGIIILVEFSDKSFRSGHNVELYHHIANTPNYHENNFKGSVSDYFRDQSGGQFELSFDVIGPIKLKNNYQYYGQNDDDDNDMYAGEMIAEACKSANNKVNFADYDWNGDGYVEQVVVIYAGEGEAAGGGTDTIWPHEWDLSYSDYGKPLFLDGVWIDTYACSSEMDGNSIDGIGTICHEFSHCLGLPDMYDMDYKNYGMGSWDIMDSGAYNGNGFRPAGFTAYEKMFCGWQQPIILSNDTVVSEMKAISEGGDTYIIYNDAHPDEYYLLENRQKTHWDSSLIGKGLLITHIDYDKNVWEWNTVNTNATYYDNMYREYTNNHQRCTVVHADNSAGFTDASIAGDTYPYLFKDSLTINSAPAATFFHLNSQKNFWLPGAIQKIKAHDDGTISFQFEDRRGAASGIRKIRTFSQPQEETIYSLQGIDLGTNQDRLPKGLYVRKGRKFVIR